MLFFDQPFPWFPSSYPHPMHSPKCPFSRVHVRPYLSIFLQNSFPCPQNLQHPSGYFFSVFKFATRFYIKGHKLDNRFKIGLQVLPLVPLVVIQWFLLLHLPSFFRPARRLFFLLHQLFSKVLFCQENFLFDQCVYYLYH